MTSAQPTVLIVDDEAEITDLFRIWLERDYEVLTASTGEEALDLLDSEVDVVLLDRMLPDLSGTEVLDRTREANYPCRVAMVTAVEPGFDVIEMGFDDYLTKPVDVETLQGTVRELVARKTYHVDVQEFYALASKKAALEASKPSGELEASAEYQQLVERVRAVRRRADRHLEQTGGFATAFYDL